MSKIKLKDYEKIEKINLEQQKALRENAKHVAMKEIQEKNEEDSYNAHIMYIENLKNSSYKHNGKCYKYNPKEVKC